VSHPSFPTELDRIHRDNRVIFKSFFPLRQEMPSSTFFLAILPSMPSSKASD
jgi:hypothetical protein